MKKRLQVYFYVSIFFCSFFVSSLVSSPALFLARQVITSPQVILSSLSSVGLFAYKFLYQKNVITDEKKEDLSQKVLEHLIDKGKCDLHNRLTIEEDEIESIRNMGWLKIIPFFGNKKKEVARFRLDSKGFKFHKRGAGLPDDLRKQLLNEVGRKEKETMLNNDDYKKITIESNSIECLKSPLSGYICNVCKTPRELQSMLNKIDTKSKE